MAVTIYGVCAVTFMMTMYALERRGPRFILAFALGCLLSSAYGFWSKAWPFGVVEFIWCGVALSRVRHPAREPISAPDRMTDSTPVASAGPSSSDGADRT